MNLMGDSWLRIQDWAKKDRATYGINSYGSIQVPRTFVLPGPYIISVTQLIPKQMKAKHGDYYDIMWDRATQELDVNRKLKIKRKWWLISQVFKDDMIAAWVDWLEEKGVSAR